MRSGRDRRDGRHCYLLVVLGQLEQLHQDVRRRHPDPLRVLPLQQKPCRRVRDLVLEGGHQAGDLPALPHHVHDDTKTTTCPMPSGARSYRVQVQCVSSPVHLERGEEQDRVRGVL